MGYVRTNKESSGKHFNKPGHTLGDTITTIIENGSEPRPLVQKRKRVPSYQKI